MYTQKHKK